VGEGGGERDGRWKGKDKTGCGLHVDYYKMKKLANGAVREAEDVDDKFSCQEHE
jgi:phosphoadenosine phosphosulfate reductase